MKSTFLNCNKYLKRILFFTTIISALSVFAEESKVKFKFYGFVRNDFFYNTRQNEESIDGVFQIYPKPIEMSDGKDINATPQAQLIAVSSRVGLDVSGSKLLNAIPSAKIEADFAGFGSNFYVLRLRQAYVKLNWSSTELLLGQTWHPMFGSVMPSIPSLNTGSPFQPFNRSPQLRVKQNIGSYFSITAAAIYQMQYTSYGPGNPTASTSYLKNAILPNFYVGLEQNSDKWTNGIGADIKTIKPDVENITSVSAIAYTQYRLPKFQVKAKAIWGQNLSDHLMPSGYGVSKVDDNENVAEYTNFNILSAWLNVAYGAKWKVGLFGGYLQNVGTDKALAEISNDFLVYGRGFYKDSQILLDRLYRVSPYVSYSISNLSISMDYSLTSATYGDLQSNGRVKNPYSVDNHRVTLSVVYTF